MPESHKRRITKSYISPNRIIGGRRQHRVVLMYHLLKQGIKNAWVSFPKSCPVENVDILDIAKNFRAEYPDIVDVFAAADLPRNFPGETDHPMHSCWLSLFDECAETLAFVSTETVFEGRRHHLTEKSFKPICLRMPFVLVSTAGSLEYLRSYGFRTFDSVWDESYDTETDDARRLAKIADLLHSLDQLTDAEKQARFEAAIPIIEHNFNHFYCGAFEKILWQELVDMLDTMKQDFGQ
jgi:predicted XRE-type DNA-binding protein